MKLTKSALVTVLFASLASTSYANVLTLKVDKIKHLKGAMMIALYNSDSNYKSDTHTYAGKRIEVSARELTVTFEDLPNGEYAIKLFQDENDNGKIDTNLIGIPTEAYGFSNNGGAMGQPGFDEAKFTVNGDTSISIHLH